MKRGNCDEKEPQKQDRDREETTKPLEYEVGFPVLANMRSSSLPLGVLVFHEISEFLHNSHSPLM